MENPSDWAQLYSHTFAKQEIPCHEDHHPFLISDQISSTTTGIAANSFSSTMNHMADANNTSSRDNFDLPYTADGRGSKPSRKRTRVSAKKDHTTVFSTDINNFRAMVQQFTGAPQAALLSMPSVPRFNLAENYSSAGMSYDEQAGQLIHPHHLQQQLMMQLLNNNNHRNDGFGNNKHVAAKMERSDGFAIADSNNSSRSTTTTTSSSYEMFPSRLSSFDHENRNSNGFVSF